MKYILLTGAYGGMGRQMTKKLSEQGYCVFALDREVDAKSCVDSAASAPAVIPIKADITKESDIICALQTVSSYTDSLYAIIHFAGIYMLDSLVEMPTEDFKRIFDINLHGVFTINKTFLPLLHKDSRIIITTSELAPLDPLPFTGIYAVTKAALDKYAYSLCMELQLLNIHVSVLRAGAVATDMLGVSTTALDRFCEQTSLYTCNADRFRRIVNRVEARNIKPEKIADKVYKILRKRRPSFAYSINRNPLLLLLNILPKRLQLFIIRMILK